MLRKAVREDAESISQLMLDHPLWQLYGLSLISQTERTKRLIDEKFALVDEDGDAVQGFVIFDMSTFGNNGYIQLLGVRLGRTGEGVGERLLRAAHETMSEVTERSFLLCTETNVAAQRFYERHGYVRVGKLSNWLQPGTHELMFCNMDIRANRQSHVNSLV